MFTVLNVSSIKPQTTPTSTMRKNLLTTIIVVFTMFCLPATNFGQYLNLGTIETASLYSVNGAISNTGSSSTFNGDVGAQIGSINNFPASTAADYTVHLSADAFTAQAKVDLLDVYILLNNIPVTNTTHAAAFTGTIDPGVYLIGSAGSINGNVQLDAKGNPNAIFIFKFQGAFSPAAATVVTLVNQASSGNVFWISEGAIAAGTNCTLVGTFISHPGAVTLGAGSNLVGRMLSTTGAVSCGPSKVVLPTTNTIPVDCGGACFNNVLGSATNFTLFTSNGATSNTGVSGVIGDIGADVGSVTPGDFASSIVIGNLHYADAVTKQASIDLLAGYNTLYATPGTVVHDGAYGGTAVETLYPGVYTTAAAGSLSGTLILDGKGKNNSIFIFKFGAAFSVASFSRVILFNGAQRCNVFWIAEGAVSMGAFAFMKGNYISHGGAISMGSMGFLEGRMFSTSGACSFNTGTTYISNALCPSLPEKPLPVKLTSFTGNCFKQNILLKWSTSNEFNNKNYDVQRSEDGKSWTLIGTIASAGNSDVALNYSFTDILPSTSGTHFYRLKQTDINNNFNHSEIISVTKCGTNENENLSFSPNPSNGQFNFNFSGDISQVSSTEIFNVQGVKVYRSNGFQSKINLTNQAPGIYLVRVQLNSKIITRKIVVSK